MNSKIRSRAIATAVVFGLAVSVWHASPVSAESAADVLTGGKSSTSSGGVSARGGGGTFGGQFADRAKNDESAKARGGSDFRGGSAGGELRRVTAASKRAPQSNRDCEDEGERCPADD